MYNRIQQIPVFKQSHRIWIGAFLLLAIMVLAACSSQESTIVPAEATIAPDISSSSDSMPTTVTATSPTEAELKGGSTEIFLQGFEDAIANSNFRSTSEFAAAAKPLDAGKKLKVGFIFVGSQKDLGYNQAAAEGSQYLEKAVSYTHLTLPTIYSV